jgi:vacuolar-type H+-ATPase subunit H
LIQKIIELRRNETKDWADEISNQEKESIELGISDADNGRLKPNSEAKKIYGKWL